MKILLLLAMSGLTPAQAQQAAVALPAPPAVPSATSENARDVLNRIRPAVIQIQGFFGSNTAQSFHGTGFAVAAGGLFVTNYHVVAEHVQQPSKYRLGYRASDGTLGAITVLKVDVRHDLALVRATGFAPEPLKIEVAVPSKGERAYAVGFPLDVGLTITEGVSNGSVEESFDARIHYSGAINGGMSGGPALNGQGVVIGANVSGYRFEQLVSFLVPARHIQALIEQAPETAVVPPAELKKAVQTQVREHSAALLGAFNAVLPTQAMSGYRLPGKLSPFIDCNGSGLSSPEQPVQSIRVSCAAKAGLYLQQGLYSGDIRYAHYVLSTDRLDAWRFTHRLSSLTVAQGAFGNQKHVGPYACSTRVVALKGFDASVIVCSRNYRRMEGLYDFTVRVSSLNGAVRGFASHLDMYGLEFGPGMNFIRQYVDAMEYVP